MGAVLAPTLHRMTVGVRMSRRLITVGRRNVEALSRLTIPQTFLLRLALVGVTPSPSLSVSFHHTPAHSLEHGFEFDRIIYYCATCSVFLGNWSAMMLLKLLYKSAIFSVWRLDWWYFRVLECFSLPCHIFQVCADMYTNLSQTLSRPVTWQSGPAQTHFHPPEHHRLMGAHVSVSLCVYFLLCVSFIMFC